MILYIWVCKLHNMLVQFLACLLYDVTSHVRWHSSIYADVTLCSSNCNETTHNTTTQLPGLTQSPPYSTTAAPPATTTVGAAIAAMLGVILLVLLVCIVVLVVWLKRKLGKKKRQVIGNCYASSDELTRCMYANPPFVCGCISLCFLAISGGKFQSRCIGWLAHIIFV